MPDTMDQDLVMHRLLDFSAGQWSNPHPTDRIATPINAAAEITNGEVDTPGKLRKRKGYSIVADDLGSTLIGGLEGFHPAGGTNFLIMETNGTIYSWNGSDASWTSRQTGLTVEDTVRFLVTNEGIFRVSQGNTIRFSSNGSTWNALTDDNTHFPRTLFALLASNQRVLAFNSSAAPNGGYWSDAGSADGANWNRTTDLQLFGQDVDSGVTGAIEFTSGEVIVFNQNKMFNWLISDTTPSNWEVQKIADIGCWAIDSVKQIGEDALFLSVDGVRSVVQSAQDKKRGNSLPLSWPIQDIIQRINWAHASKSRAAVWDDRYILAVPLDSATVPDTALVWSRRAFEANSGQGGWTIWNNFNVNAWGVRDFGDTPRLYFGESSADSKVYFARSSDTSEEDTSDNGTAITLTVQTMRINQDVPELDKSYETVEVRATAQDSGTIEVSSQIEGGGYTDIGSFDQDEGIPVLPQVLPFDLVSANVVNGKFDLQRLGRGRNIQHRIVESTLDADSEILSVTTSAFVEDFELNE